MHCKIFYGNDPERLEQEINTWLAQHDDIYLHYITQSQDAGTEFEIGPVYVIVWYMLMPKLL